jgi:hypothetical protein
MRRGGHVSAGELFARLANAGTDDEYVVAECADDVVLASPELVEAWLSGTRHVTVDGDRFTLGTEGHGEGVVTYRLHQRDERGNYLMLRVKEDDD